jgi:pentalenic acid synthase
LFVPELADEATTELGDYLDRLIGRKERNPATPGTPGAGLLDDLIVEQLHTGAIGRSELVHIAMSMLVAGTDTTTNVISLGTLALLDTPGQWEALRDDLSLVRGAVDEILRYVSLVEVFARVAAEDLTVGGQEIKAGDGMLISCAVPNFDPTWAVADPQAFDIRRPPRQHLAFSHGIHRCIGDNLARLELEVAFATLAARMPNLRPAAPISQMPTNNDGTLQRLYQFPILW